MAGDSPLSLIDVLSVPTVGAAVLQCLECRCKGALRGSCSTLCALVDRHIEALRIYCRGPQDVLVARRLARKGWRPQQLTLTDNVFSTDISLSAMAALLAAEQHHPLFQCVQHLKLEGKLPKELPEDVFASMPLLKHLVYSVQELTAQRAQMLAAVRLDMLHSLTVRMDLSHAQFLHGCTQLQALTLFIPTYKGVHALAQLTALTQLELSSGSYFSDTDQSELGSVLAALSKLQSLNISRAPPGPVTQALSQLAGLTELTLYCQNLVPNPGPLCLPSCVKLKLAYDVTIQHLASIQAPKLQRLHVSLRLQLCDLDSLRWQCRGVLRACSSLSLTLADARRKEESVALMAVLSQDWQPSAEALQPNRPRSVGLDQSGSSQPPRLKLFVSHCSRQCLELLPKGLGALHLDSCLLDPDSLEAVAQVMSVRELSLTFCTGVTLASLERLLSTAVQGCLLTVIVDYCCSLKPPEACSQMRQRVLEQRGSRDTPVLAYRRQS